MGQSYLLRRDGRDYQAQDLDTMRQWARDGRVLPSDMVYSPRYQSWYRARDLRELRDVLPVVEAPPKVAPPAARPPQQFWLRKGDQNYAADGLDTILRWAAEGNISPDDFIYHPAYGKWFRAGDSPQLANRFPQHIARSLPFLPASEDPMSSASQHPGVAGDDPSTSDEEGAISSGDETEPVGLIAAIAQGLAGPTQLDPDPVESADSMARTVMDFKASDLQKALAAREAELAAAAAGPGASGAGTTSGATAGTTEKATATFATTDQAARVEVSPTLGAGGGLRRVEPRVSGSSEILSRPTPAPVFEPRDEDGPALGPALGLEPATTGIPLAPSDGPLGRPRPSGAAVVNPRHSVAASRASARRETHSSAPSHSAASFALDPTPALPGAQAEEAPAAPAHDSIEMLDPDEVMEVRSEGPQDPLPEVSSPPGIAPAEPAPRPEAPIAATLAAEPTPSPLAGFSPPDFEIIEPSERAERISRVPVEAVAEEASEPDLNAQPTPYDEPEALDETARYIDRLNLMKLFYDVARVFVVTKDLRPGELVEANCKLQSTGDEFLGQAKRAIYHTLAKRMREHLDGPVAAAGDQVQPDNLAGYKLFVRRAEELVLTFQHADEVVGRKPPERVVVGNSGRAKMTPVEEEALLRIDAALKALISIKQKASEAA